MSYQCIYPQQHSETVPSPIKDWSGIFASARKRHIVKYRTRVEKLEYLIEQYQHFHKHLPDDPIFLGKCKMCMGPVIMGKRCQCCSNKTCPRCLCEAKLKIPTNDPTQGILKMSVPLLMPT